MSKIRLSQRAIETLREHDHKLLAQLSPIGQHLISSALVYSNTRSRLMHVRSTPTYIVFGATLLFVILEGVSLAGSELGLPYAAVLIVAQATLGVVWLVRLLSDRLVPLLCPWTRLHHLKDTLDEVPAPSPTEEVKAP